MVELADKQRVPLLLHSARLQNSYRAERVFKQMTLGCALFVAALFLGIIFSLVDGAWPAIRAFGLGFLYTEAWNPVTERFGALAPIYGTLLTSLIALMISVPIGIGIAIFLTELCPRQLRRPIGIAVELLAGIPSIIYGIWGLFVLAPILQQSLMPALIATFDGVPVLGTLFAGPPYGIGIFTAGLILAIMTLPFVAAITRDVSKPYRRCSRRPPTGSEPPCGKCSGMSCCPTRARESWVALCWRSAARSAKRWPLRS